MTPEVTDVRFRTLDDPRTFVPNRGEEGDRGRKRKGNEEGRRETGGEDEKGGRRRRRRRRKGDRGGGRGRGTTQYGLDDGRMKEGWVTTGSDNPTNPTQGINLGLDHGDCAKVVL